MQQTNVCQVSEADQKDDISSIANKSPVIGAEKAEATPI